MTPEFKKAAQVSSVLDRGEELERKGLVRRNFGLLEASASCRFVSYGTGFRVKGLELTTGVWV